MHFLVWLIKEKSVLCQSDLLSTLNPLENIGVVIINYLYSAGVINYSRFVCSVICLLLINSCFYYRPFAAKDSNLE